MYKKIAIATHNKNKIKELKFLFSQHGIKVHSASELGQLEEPQETGTTFFENALIKAKALQKYTKLPIVADDSGLCIEILDNQPGIYSARWMIADGNKSSNIGIQKIYKEISNKISNTENPNNKYLPAKFVCSLALLVDGESQEFLGSLPGNITLNPQGNAGFGYDSIFIPDQYSCTLAEIDFETKQKISHRKKALNKLIKYINEQNLP